MTKYLENEEDFLPWSSAISALTYIKQRIYDRDVVTIFKVRGSRLFMNSCHVTVLIPVDQIKAII